MKSVVLLFLLALPLQVLAEEKPVSDESIRQLIEVTESRKVFDNMLPQIDAMMEQTMKQAMGTTTFTPGQQKIMDEMRQKILTIFKEEMNWDSLEPHIIAIYKEAFTEEEVKGLLEFYRSSAGQAMIKKMPVVMQGTMKMTQEQLQRILPKLQEIQTETTSELTKCCKDDG